MARRTAAKREMISKAADKRYGRCTPEGQFKESDDLGKRSGCRRNATTRAKRSG